MGTRIKKFLMAKAGKKPPRPFIIGILVVLFIPLIAGAIVGAQPGGFTSWRSINMTGVDDSYVIIGRSGVGNSRFKVDTTALLALPPTNLGLMVVSDYEITITWTKGVNAENSMVRGAVGREPEDREDGYLVYYGTDTTCTDTGVSLDETATVVYYRVWSQSAGGIWEEVGISDNTGGSGMTFLAFLAIPIAFMLGFFWKKSNVLAFIAAGGWILVGFFAFGQSESTVMPITDVYMGLFWLSIVAAIGCILLPAVMREKPSKDDIYPEEFDEVTGEPIKREEPRTRRNRMAR